MAQPLRFIRAMPHPLGRCLVAVLLSVAALGSIAAATNMQGGPIPGPLPIFPPDNWWNLDISTAPVDPASVSYINFIGPAKTLHPDFYGEDLMSPRAEHIAHQVAAGIFLLMVIANFVADIVYRGGDPNK